MKWANNCHPWYYALRDYFLANANATQTHKYGIIPHHLSIESKPDKWNIGPEFGVVIDDQMLLVEVIRQISSCAFIVSECLHGAICADALGIPTAVVQTSYQFHSFKWLDWAASMNRELCINQLIREDGCIDHNHLETLKFDRSKPDHISSLVQRLHEKGEEAVEIFNELRNRQ